MFRAALVAATLLLAALAAPCAGARDRGYITVEFVSEQEAAAASQSKAQAKAERKAAKKAEREAARARRRAGAKATSSPSPR